MITSETNHQFFISHKERKSEKITPEMKTRGDVRRKIELIEDARRLGNDELFEVWEQ
jgi:hypothetical protein